MLINLGWKRVEVEGAGFDEPVFCEVKAMEYGLYQEAMVLCG